MEDTGTDVRDLDAAALQALSHPTRARLLMALGADGGTVSGLARRLDMNKGNIAHHLAVLEDVGLVRRGDRRTVRGGTEQRFERVAQKVRGPSGGGGGAASALLAAVAQEAENAPGEPLLHLRRLRLTVGQAAALAEHLDRLVASLPEAPPGAPRHSVLVAVHRVRR
ncbi:MAG: ArsR/SmtB family transcription factor [Phycicoccus sp.]